MEWLWIIPLALLSLVIGIPLMACCLFLFVEQLIYLIGPGK